MKLVDFFIVGEPKSGTTALAQFIGEHPSVGIATPKEPHYFATDLQCESDDYHGVKNHHFAIRTPEQYANCFAAVATKPLLGEGSTHYLVSAEAAANIAAYNPRAKIIIMLRNPVDFVHSLHMQYVNNGSEDVTDFAQALALEPSRRAGNQLPVGVRCPSHVYYSERVDYSAHVQRFMDKFPSQQLLIITMEQFSANNQAVYEQVRDFLELDTAAPLPDFKVVHGSKGPRNQRLHRLLNHPRLKYGVLKIVGANRYDNVKDAVAKLVLQKQPRPILPPELRAELQERYRPDAERVAALLQRPDILKLWHYEN